MNTKEFRLKELKLIGAGDEACVECLDLGVREFSLCESCINATTAISEAVDAARYRWLKEYCFSQSKGELYFCSDDRSGDLDKAIDVAMKERTK